MTVYVPQIPHRPQPRAVMRVQCPRNGEWTEYPITKRNVAYAARDCHQFGIPYRITEEDRQAPSMDVYKASPFGDVHVLINGGANVYAAQPLIQRLRRELLTFSDGDYVLPVGEQVLVSFVVAVAASMNSGRVKLLKWDKALKKYNVIQSNVYGGAV